MQLYSDCDVSTLPTIRNVYHPPESMNMRQLAKYATELRAIVDPFDKVTPEEDETVNSFCDNEDDLDLKNDTLKILLSWERIVMTDPLPDHLKAMTPETLKCLSPATKRLVESRSGLEPQSVKKDSTIKTRKKNGGAVVEVDDVPLNFVPEVWSEIPPGEGLSFLPEKGCYRKTFPACLASKVKGSARRKTFPVVDAEYSDKFGATYAVLLTLDCKDRPAWDLNRKGTTQTLVSVIVTGATMIEVIEGPTR